MVAGSDISSSKNKMSRLDPVFYSAPCHPSTGCHLDKKQITQGKF